MKKISFSLLLVLVSLAGFSQSMVILKQRAFFNLNGVATEGLVRRNYNVYPATEAGDRAVVSAIETGLLTVTVTSGTRINQVIQARVTSPPPVTNPPTTPPATVSWLTGARSRLGTDNLWSVQANGQAVQMAFNKQDGGALSGGTNPDGATGLMGNTFYVNGDINDGGYTKGWQSKFSQALNGVPAKVTFRLNSDQNQTVTYPITLSANNQWVVLSGGNTSPPPSTTVTNPPTTPPTSPPVASAPTVGYGGVYAANSSYVPTAETPRNGSGERNNQYNRVYMDNGTLKIGYNLTLGGSIDFMGINGSKNQLNSPIWGNGLIDAGRQHLWSWYSSPGGGTGPFGDGHFEEEGQSTGRWGGTGEVKTNPDGSPKGSIGWNPVEAGDEGQTPTYGVLHWFSVNSFSAYIKNSGRQWNMHGVTGKQDNEKWLRYDPNNARAYREHCRLTMRRTDQFINRFPEARVQEAPCNMHVVDYRNVTFSSGRPYSNDWHTLAINATGFPSYLLSNEPFVIICNADQTLCHAFYGPASGRFGTDMDRPESNVSNDYEFPVTYLASAPYMILDHDGVYDFDVAGFYGSLADAKAWCYQQPRWSGAFNYVFNQKSRHGFFYHHAQDQTEKNITDGLRVRAQTQFTETFGRDMKVEAPEKWVDGRTVKRIYIKAAFSGAASSLRFHWYRTTGNIQNPFVGSVNRTEYTMPMSGIQFDGVMRVYEVNVESNGNWNNQDIIGFGFGFDYPYPNDVNNVLWDIRQISSTPILNGVNGVILIVLISLLGGSLRRKKTYGVRTTSRPQSLRPVRTKQTEHWR